MIKSAVSDKKIELLSRKYQVDPKLILQLQKVDPSGGSFLEWIVRSVKNGQIRPEDEEDLTRARNALIFFNRVRQSKNVQRQYKVESPDISKYTIFDIEKMMSGNKEGETAKPQPAQVKIDFPSVKTKEGAILQPPKKGEAIVVYNKPPWFIIEAKTPAAAMYLGHHQSSLDENDPNYCRWCTKSLAQSKSYLDQGSPLYIIYKNGIKWAQYHLASDQLKNIKDRDWETR